MLLSNDRRALAPRSPIRRAMTAGGLMIGLLGLSLVTLQPSAADQDPVAGVKVSPQDAQQDKSAAHPSKDRVKAPPKRESRTEDTAAQLAELLEQLDPHLRRADGQHLDKPSRAQLQVVRKLIDQLLAPQPDSSDSVSWAMKLDPRLSEHVDRIMHRMGVKLEEAKITDVRLFTYNQSRSLVISAPAKHRETVKRFMEELVEQLATELEQGAEAEKRAQAKVPKTGDESAAGGEVQAAEGRAAAVLELHHLQGDQSRLFSLASRLDLSSQLELLKLDRAEAELDLEAAKSALRHGTRLFERGIVGQDDVDRLEHAVRRAEIRIKKLDVLRSGLSRAKELPEGR